jgi:hypothetical protein
MRRTLALSAVMAALLAAPAVADPAALCPEKMQVVDVSMSADQAAAFCKCFIPGQAAMMAEFDKELRTIEPSMFDGRKPHEINMAMMERAGRKADEHGERLVRRCAAESGADGDRLVTLVRALSASRRQ